MLPDADRIGSPGTLPDTDPVASPNCSLKGGVREASDEDGQHGDAGRSSAIPAGCYKGANRRDGTTTEAGMSPSQPTRHLRVFFLPCRAGPLRGIHSITLSATLGVNRTQRPKRVAIRPAQSKPFRKSPFRCLPLFRIVPSMLQAAACQASLSRFAMRAEMQSRRRSTSSASETQARAR